MILLGIDTCGSGGTIALASVGRREALEVLGAAELPGRSAAARLIPEVQRVLCEAGVSLSQVAGVVVVDGPGSFTGIRIGLSTAKALAEAAGLPLFAISRLRVLSSGNDGSPCALDGGRGEVYFGGCGGTEEATGAQAEWLLTEEELHARLVRSNASLIVCEQKLASLFPEARLVAAPTAADALRAALAQVLDGQQTEVAGLDGRYLRRSDPYRASAGI